jgi:hypothetical protein
MFKIRTFGEPKGGKGNEKAYMFNMQRGIEDNL